jgi:hypothetical protein
MDQNTNNLFTEINFKVLVLRKLLDFSEKLEDFEDADLRKWFHYCLHFQQLLEEHSTHYNVPTE